MNATDLLVLLPHILLGYGATVLLVLGAFWRRPTGLAGLAVLIFLGTFAAALAGQPLLPRQVTPLLRVDSLSLFFLLLFSAAGVLLTLFSRDYLAGLAGVERFYALLLYAVLGMSVLAASVHFAAFFLGMQLLSVSLYGLIGFTRRRSASLEASLKYLVLGGISLAFLLLGIALLYSEFGTLAFPALAARFGAGGALPALALFGLGLILVAFVFKLALAPAHVWAPDVYQGAPAPVTALLATGSKAAMFALLVRFVALVALRERVSLLVLLEVFALATMSVGNLLALLQRNLKRLLAYSSVANMGYLLIPVAAGGLTGVSSLSFYFISYFLTTLGAFGVIAALSRQGEEFERLEDYQGLAARRPWLAAALGVMMLSLAGLPPTVGFMAKFYIFSAAAQSRLWLLLLVGVINSGISLYYYLQVLVAMYLRSPEPSRHWPRVRLASGVALVALTLAVVAFGLYPAPLIAGTRRMAGGWFAQQAGGARGARPLVYPSPETRSRRGGTDSGERASGEKHELVVPGTGQVRERGQDLFRRRVR